MTKPEPTWTQKAQQCKAELDGCHDQLERFKGIEQMLREANERIREMEQTSPDLSALPRQIEFWKREAQTAQQREGALQGRVQRLENALREAPTKDLVESLSDALAEAKEDARRAAQQAAECTRRAAGMVQRLQQFQTATEALRAMEQAADEWQRKATVVARENSELRQQVAVLPELQQELVYLRHELETSRAGENRANTRVREIEPAARALPTVKADLVQKTEALEKVQRELHQATQQRDQAQIDREELATLRRASEEREQRLMQAAAELERKQRELTELTPAARALPTVKADLAQVHAELEKVRRQLRVVTIQRDQAVSEATRARQKLDALKGQLD